MRAPVLALFLLYIVPAYGNEERPTGPNCDLAVPPAAAGEVALQRLLLKVYPRASEIDARYSGCQAIWRMERDRFEAREPRAVLLALVAVHRGEPVRMWHSPAWYGAPTAQLALAKSYPAGCLEEMAVANTITVPRCRYE